ncbi:MAG: DUF285 domain-containing protein, partial [Clostridia bacterium]|nr:DUF285 domain-containing protein [Clostridia bacterium]
MLKLKSKKFIFGILLCLCAAFLACGIFAISNTTISAHAATAITPTIYWGLDEETGVLQIGNDPSAVNGTITGNFLGTENFSSGGSDQWLNHKKKILTVDIVTEVVPSSIRYWFNGCSNLTNINNIGNIDTSNVTDMQYLFQDCSSLTELDLSSWDTSNVTNFQCTFDGCSNLYSLNMLTCDFSKVKNVSYMFIGANNLKEVAFSATAAKTICSKVLTGNKFFYDEDGNKYTASNPPASGGTYTTYVPHEHNYKLTATLKAATCTTDGSAQYTCTVTDCEKKKTETIPAKGHKPGTANCSAPQVCTVCNETLAAAGEHTPGPAATCTEPQKCTVCQT